MEVKIFGKSVKEACLRAKSSIFERHIIENPVVIKVPKDYGTAAYALWVIRAAEALRSDKAISTIKAIPEEQRNRVIHYAKMYNSSAKLCLKLTGRAAASYKSKWRLTRRKGDVYYFFWK
ncbi:hypothetical protein [Microscilla marina]|uniref:Uncharacterized protein n=1 Tax=Microscilla marina ATCC 23134 TaxID=313606 RepID=A1ZIN4_MICM2|nr:hypothetical protein [Microscilla marina]EAY25643.1 hypothetical protein M23134_07294 [Microscilla marina ATCC 23134]EAY29902.1 hypothetical protein M23134_05775 [Microscilla marina ATCC 23134]